MVMTTSASAKVRDKLSELAPVTFEVLRSHFEYTCERMSKIMKKTAFSPIIYDMVDFSNAIYDGDIRLVGQAANCPVHLAAMHFSAAACVTQYGYDNIHEGDVIVLNDPYSGGTHIPDTTFTMPIYFEGRLLGFAVSRAHWTDLGGGAAGGYSYGTHIATEGLRIPPIKLFNRNEINDEFRRLLIANSRTPQYVEGDILAHLGALRAAEQELIRAANRYGEETVRTAMREVIAYTERMTRKAISEIPDGVYEASDYLDTDGITEKPIRIIVRLIVEGDDITVDFTGTDKGVVGAVNSPLANTYSAVYYSLKFFLSPDAPANAGMYAPVKIILPEDCFLNAKWPAPTIGSTTLTSSKITSAIWQALALAMPERITAPTCADANPVLVSVTDPATNVTSVFADLPPGGWGGTPYDDGMNATMDPLGNCLNLPAETAELHFPVVYEAFDLRQDSAGPGKRRGGVGARLKIRFLGPTELSVGASHMREGTPGVNGGKPSVPQRVSKLGPGDATRQVIGGLCEDGGWRKGVFAYQRFEQNEAYLFEATGGGGWGDPLERPVEQVLEDVLDEYVSVDAARAQYGVVIDPSTMTVNDKATCDLRESMRPG